MFQLIHITTNKPLRDEFHFVRKWDTDLLAESFRTRYNYVDYVVRFV